MKPKSSLLLLSMTATFLGLAPLAEAAPQRAGGLMGRFEETAPEVGQKLPDLEALDAQGRPFPLSRLKGSYTVLVFGCLT